MQTGDHASSKLRLECLSTHKFQEIKADLSQLMHNIKILISQGYCLTIPTLDLPNSIDNIVRNSRYRFFIINIHSYIITFCSAKNETSLVINDTNIPTRTNNNMKDPHVQPQYTPVPSIINRKYIIRSIIFTSLDRKHIATTIISIIIHIKQLESTIPFSVSIIKARVHVALHLMKQVQIIH
jgi:hypothetical protein